MVDVHIRIVRAHFLLGSLAILFAARYDSLLKPLLLYGKTVQTLPPRSKVIDSISTLAVPKKWFRHFYILSILCGVISTCWLVWDDAHSVGVPRFATSNVNQSRSTALLSCVLMLFQSCRRYYEMHYVERPSDNATMWIGHYFAGLSFYFFANIAMFGESMEDHSKLAFANLPSRRLFVAILIFMVGSATQFWCHLHLASVRESLKPGKYLNVRHGLFRYFVAPHYSAEVMIYFGIVVLNVTNVTLWLVLLWVVSILAVGATYTDQWGKLKFDDWGQKWLLIPFIF